MFLPLIKRPTPPKHGIALPPHLPLVALPSILLSVTAICFWLDVAFKFIDWQPFKAAVYFIFVSFSLLNLTPQMMGRCPPTRSLPRAPPLYHPLYHFRRLSG